MKNNRERWAGLAVAALMPVVLTWFACILVISFIYLLTASAPSLDDIAWSDALHFGTSIWLVSMGATVRIEAARISLIPLTITIVTWWLSLRSAKRALISTWEDVAVYTVISAIFSALLGFADLKGTFLISAVLGVALLGFTASVLAWWSRVPSPVTWWRYVEDAWRWARPMLIGATVCAGVAFLAALIVSHKRVGAIYGAYMAHWAGNLGITFVQLLYLPVFLIWSLAFVSGVPFHIGSGTSFSPFNTTTAPMPGIPVFGAIPSASTALRFLPLLLVIVGALSAWWGLRSLKKDKDARLVVSDVDVATGTGSTSTFRKRAIDAGIALGIVYIAFACAGALASGGFGSGRMCDMGLNAPLFALLATAELALGLFAVLFVARRKN